MMNFIDTLPEMMSLQQLAKAFAINSRAALRAVHSGELKAYRVGKEWRIYREDVRNWVKTNDGSAEPTK